MIRREDRASIGTSCGRLLKKLIILELQEDAIFLLDKRVTVDHVAQHG
jgi:hypothetical protein